MRFSFSLVVAAAALLVRADSNDTECEADEVTTPTLRADSVAAENTTTAAVDAVNTTTVFAPVLSENVNVHAVANVVPVTNISLAYAANDSASSMNVSHVMKYPTVVLEDIAAITNVTCSPSEVVVTFSNSTVFNATETAWSAENNFVLVTNHLGGCDPELERGMFLVNSVEFDAAAMSITCVAAKSNISTTAATTEIYFGGLSGTALSKRTTLDPTYTLNFAAALPDDTVLYSYSPYVTVTADTTSVSAAITFSGYLNYNWLTFSIQDLYFDIDTDFSSDLTLSADVTSSYATTFSYAPSTLSYSLISVPGILELGPALKFAIGAGVSVSEAVVVTSDLGIAVPDGNVHLDLLHEENTSTSGWTPTYTASVNVSGTAEAEFNPYVSLTVEMAISFLGGLVDLSSGLTAKPGFNNTLTLTAAEGVDLVGVTGTTSNGTCAEGLEVASKFVFELDGFATQWVSADLYSTSIPLFDKCYSWA